MIFCDSESLEQYGFVSSFDPSLFPSGKLSNFAFYLISHIPLLHELESLLLLGPFLQSINNHMRFLMPLHNIEWISNLGELLESLQMHCLPRICFFDIPTIVIFHISHFPFKNSADEGVITFKDSFFNQDTCRGLAAFFVNVGFDNYALSWHAMVFHKIKFFLR